MCDRPANIGGESINEIEITPEMVASGVSVLLAADYRFERHENVVKEILEEAFKKQSTGARVSPKVPVAAFM